MSENTNIGLTVEAWADIVIERWELKVARLHLKGTGNLLKSFYRTVYYNSNGNPELIVFIFEYYGKFLDMGVGRGVSYHEVEFSERKRKPWLNRTFYKQLFILRKILEEKYALKAQMAIITEVEKNE